MPSRVFLLCYLSLFSGLATYQLLCLLEYTLCLYLITFFIELIQVMLVNKIIQVSGAQCYKTHHLYNVLCVHHPKSSLPPSPFIPLIPFSTFPHTPDPGNNQTVVCVYEFFLIFILFCSIPPPSTQPSP